MRIRGIIDCCRTRVCDAPDEGRTGRKPTAVGCGDRNGINTAVHLARVGPNDPANDAGCRINGEPRRQSRTRAERECVAFFIGEQGANGYANWDAVLISTVRERSNIGRVIDRGNRNRSDSSCERTVGILDRIGNCRDAVEITVRREADCSIRIDHSSAVGRVHANDHDGRRWIAVWINIV